MTPEELKNRNFENEFIFSASRSSGPGGQNINKVSSKVELRFNLNLTSHFTETEKEIIFNRLRNKINIRGEIILVSQSERSQLMNKLTVTEKFYQIISDALTFRKKRKATVPTLSSKVKRLERKRSRGIIKKLRKDTGRSGDN
jgi:ribosome-associated protein